MPDKMMPIPFNKMLDWIFQEYENERTIFGIPEEKFYRKKNSNILKIFREDCDLPIGPAAGPNTQLAQNIIASFLTGGRFIELKTVQVMDKLKIEKPCIEALNEGYNTEWSTELTVEQAFDEYLKAWLTCRILNKALQLSLQEKPNLIFNMSVGYDLKGIQTPKIDAFIEQMKNAELSPLFNEYKNLMHDFFKKKPDYDINEKLIDSISPNVSKIATLSTMHGCPPEEQESITRYLIGEKKLDTLIKLNPTLNGFDFTRKMLNDLGYVDIELDEKKFTHDLQYTDALIMLDSINKFALENNKGFAIKLSNTLPVVNTKGILPGKEMYMSGKALFPLTFELAKKLKKDMTFKLMMSYSGGASLNSIELLINLGLYPITVCTEILKPGGYMRIRQMAEAVDYDYYYKKLVSTGSFNQDQTNVEWKQMETNLRLLMNNELTRAVKDLQSKKINKLLPLFDCYTAPCKETCPIGQDVPEYINLIKKEKYEKALQVIMAKNPLPHITGYICDHQCMNNCTRNFYDRPVEIRSLKKTAGIKGFENFLNSFKPDIPKHKKEEVCIIGAGPAGLAAASLLTQTGFSVTVIDKEKDTGGVVRYILPDFRYPKEVIEKDVAFLKKMGVKFILGEKQNIDPGFLKKQNYSIIIFATGTPHSNQLILKDGKSIASLDFLYKYNLEPQNNPYGKSIAVIGGGNSAMDSARAALKLPGVEKVYIIYRRTADEMPADLEEFDNAIYEGAEFLHLLQPLSHKEGILECRVMKLGEKDDSGRRSPAPVEGQMRTFKIDTVISAVGESPDKKMLEEYNIEISAKSHKTNIENVYVCGDLFTGPSTVVRCIADAKKTVCEILEDLKDIKKFRMQNVFNSEELLETYNADNNHESEIRKSHGKVVYSYGKDVKENRDNSFKTRDEEVEESEKCLLCNWKCNICVEVCPNRANASIRLQDAVLQKKSQILHLDYSCNECGNCETFCPYLGAPYKDKFTYFSNESSFADSKNNGFTLLDKNTFRVRINETTFNGTFDNGNITTIPQSDEEKKSYRLIEAIIRNYFYLLI